MKLLIYGAGVIGCCYAALFREAGYDVSVYARGKRLESLRENGLMYLKKNKSPNIVTMVNTLEPYSNWEKICGKGRIIPAFPGAGGCFDGNVLNAALTPWIIQPTTFAEIHGERTARIKLLADIFRKSKIPYQIVKDMQSWQLCHLAMVVPIADAYYEANCPEKAGQERKLMEKTAKRMKRNFHTLHKMGVCLSPKKMNLFRVIPISLLKNGLRFVFQSDFGNIFMYQHSMKAPDEMRWLHKQFYQYIKYRQEP